MKSCIMLRHKMIRGMNFWRRHEQIASSCEDMLDRVSFAEITQHLVT